MVKEEKLIKLKCYPNSHPNKETIIRYSKGERLPPAVSDIKKFFLWWGNRWNDFPLHWVNFEMIYQDWLRVRKFISSSAQSNGKSFPRWLSVRKNALGVDVTWESGFEVLTQNILCKRRNAGYPE
jgi:hypothetical protein